MNHMYVMWIICGICLAAALWQTFRAYRFLGKITDLSKELEKYTKPEDDKQAIIDAYLNRAGEIASNEASVPDYVGESRETEATVKIEKLAGEVFVKGAAEWDKQVEHAGEVALAKANAHKPEPTEKEESNGNNGVVAEESVNKVEKPTDSGKNKKARVKVQSGNPDVAVTKKVKKQKPKNKKTTQRVLTPKKTKNG